MAFLLMLSASAKSQSITAPWTLTVGGADVSPFVHNSARFVEKASSTDGLATFTLNGAHAAVSVGASVLLTAADGSALWEGTVSSATPQYDANDTQVATMVLATPLAAQLDIATNYVVSQATDVADIAHALCAQTSVPFASQSGLGSSGGTLSVQNVASGLSVAALIARRDWRVENGSVTFVGPDTLKSLSEPLSGITTSGSAVVVLGGLDTQTKQPLKGSFSTLASGPSLQAAHPEISDHDTLSAAGAALAQRYGVSAVTMTATLEPGTVVRAGDWFVDPNGSAAIAHQVEHKLVGGTVTPTISLGYPQLPVASPVADTPAQRAAHYPTARLANDFLVSGAGLSPTGLVVTLGDAQIVVAGAPYAISGSTLTLDASATALITVSNAGFAFADSTVLPQPGTAVPLYVVTTDASGVVGWEDVAPRGGIGNYHLKPANPTNTPVVSAGSISLAAEGATAAKATIPFSITGLTLDDTIGSIEVVQSFAGENQWGNSHVLEWSPGALSYTDYRHGLSAAQSYDLAVNILGRDGKPLNASPLIIGASPTISSSAIAIALNLDQVPDGTTYGRVKATELQGGAGGAGTVMQLNDGTSIRTVAHIANAITGSGTLNLAQSAGYLPHANTSTEYQANFDSSGTLLKSTAFIGKTPNTIAYVTDATIECSWSGTGPYSVKIWYDNGTAGSDSSVVYPDGSPTVNLGHSTSSSPSYSESNVASGTNYYAVLSRSSSGTVSLQIQKTPFSLSQFSPFFADGGIVPAAAQTGSPLFTASGSGGSGSVSGGGGGHTVNKA